MSEKGKDEAVEATETKKKGGTLNIEATSGYLKEQGIEKVSANYDFGNDLAEAVEKFGEETVFTNFIANSAVTLQSNYRRWAKKWLEDEDNNVEDGGVALSTYLQGKADKWVIGVISREKMSKVEKAFKATAGMTKEQLEEYAAKIQAQLAAA